ncbi:MAG: hypothetical protein ABI056_03205 [Caulobacteraceae bacterium]
MSGEDGANAAGCPIRETPAPSAWVHRAFPVLAFALVLCAAIGAIVVSAGQERAPADRGVCWRSLGVRPERSTLRPVAHDIASLEDCAADLEARRLIDGRAALGAYQSYYVFVDGAAITSSATLRGFRYPIFQPGQRRAVDEGLLDLIHARHGAMPAAADMVVER